MKKFKHLAWHRATEEELLAVFRADYEFNKEWHPDSSDDEELTFETTIETWRRVIPLVEWQPLSRALNYWFRVHFDEETWQQTLLPEKQRTLRDVCELLATKAWQPHVHMRRLLGPPCKTGNTFLAMCELLRKEGIPTKDIRPSTPLEEYARRYPGIIHMALSSLAPGAVPVPKEHSIPTKDRLEMICAFSLVLGCIGLYQGSTLLITFSALALIGSVYGIVHSFKDAPEPVTFGQLVTFGDMAQLIARGAPSKFPEQN